MTESKNDKKMYIKSFCITSDEEVGGVRCAGPMSVAPSSELFLLLLRWWKIGQRWFSIVKIA